jgi:sterol desaturase/sphingolipid hydroxylase (fatty acid hydroxylase superfamily)
MSFNILAFAVPLFIAFMLLEYFIARKRKLNYFNLHNSIANISIGIAERLCDVLVTGVFFFVFDYLQKHYAIWSIKPNIFLWILLLLFTDFIWYWYHRFAHEFNILWGVHVVHHQSEDYNYTVSARITVLQALVRTCFWSVLSIIGFPASMITVMLLIHGIYPFFIHTRLVGNLGILEYLFVTPSHHRVHHASNDKYLDKNYGDVFIIWDKLFGTFQKEDEEAPVYGLTHPLNSYSFLWQHFHFYIELWLAFQQQKSWKNKLSLLFQKPEKLDSSLRQKAETIFNIKQSKASFTKPLNKYVVWQMIILLMALFAFILLEKRIGLAVQITFIICTFITLINCGAIMEQKKWIFYLEGLRLFFIMLLPFFYKEFIVYQMLVCTLLLLVITLYYTNVKERYLAYVYKSS